MTKGRLEKFEHIKGQIKWDLENANRIYVISEFVVKYRITFQEVWLILEMLKREGMNIRILKLPKATIIIPPKVDIRTANIQLIKELFAFRILKEEDKRIIIETEYPEVLDDLTKELSKFLEKFEEERNLIISPAVG